MRSAVVLLLLMSSGELYAEEPSPAETAVAREQFNLGVAAAKENRWEDAHDAFSRSYALTKKTSILFNLAGAQVKTGRWVEARETYRMFLREVSADQKQAKSEAQRLLTTLEAQIPRVVISLEGDRQDDVLSLDGRELSSAMLGVELPLNPGRHLMIRLRNGAEVARQEIEIAASERRELALAAPVEPAPPPPVPPPPPPMVEVPPPPVVEEEESFFAGPWFWVIAGAVVVAGGVATSVVLLNREPEPYAGSTGIVLRGLEP